MLYVLEQSGQYALAPTEKILAAATTISKARLQAGVQINSSRDAIDAIAWQLRPYQVEVFACLFLNSNHQCLGFEEICSGTINANVIHPREVVKQAFALNAAAVILAHNHPSGNPTPSKQDKELTTLLVKVLEPLRIQVLDHLVIGDEVVSFADLGFFR